jgi:hypothetical protein
MNTYTRVYRILSRLSSFRQIETADRGIIEQIKGRLGKPLGCYQNPPPSQEVIYILEDGLLLFSISKVSLIEYSSIRNVSIDGKNALEISIITNDGEEILLQVKGNDGKFFDSLEMLRFLDRVIADVKGKVRGT